MTKDIIMTRSQFDKTFPGVFPGVRPSVYRTTEGLQIVIVDVPPAPTPRNRKERRHGSDY